MDKTATWHTSTFHVNKKSNESEKFTESFLCDEIHDNLRTLALIYPFSDELKDVFEKGMFIKPNAKAFPHSIRYLLMICDATEFKKKFCWPIYNKAAEATFRNATLELLNKLNARYSLGFAEVKNKILIFPGGMEFMRVIYELTRLSMQLTLKRNGIVDPDSQRSISLFAAKEHLDKLEDVCDFVMNYKTKVQDLSTKLKGKTEILHELLLKVTANTNIKTELILRDDFTESWAEAQNDIIKRNIEPDIKRLDEFEENIQRLEEKICTHLKQQTLKFDANALTAFSTEMQKHYPQHYQRMSTIVDNGHINLDHMLQALKLAIPLMLQSIELHKPRSIEAMAYESSQLQKLSQKTDVLLQQVLELSTAVDMRVEEEVSGLNFAPAFEHIQSMILSTPTISQEAIRRAETAKTHIKRISLLDDAHHLRSKSTLGPAAKPLNFVSEENRANQSGQKLFLSPNRLFGKEPKSKLDPMAILQSITKKEKKEKHAPSGAFKPKTINFGSSLALATQHEHSKENDTILSVPDFSSTLLNHSGNVKDTQLSFTEQINTSLAKSMAKVTCTSGNDRKMRSFLKADAFESPDRDINLNSSPSGRIESLVSSKIRFSDIIPTKLNEKDSNNQKTNLCVTPIQQIVSSDTNGKSITRDLTNIENNQNALNKCAFNLNSMINENDESLLNMSDQILNDLDDSIIS